MKKQSIKFFAILFCIAVFAALGEAKPVKSVEFEIPFDFAVKGEDFPAGRYVVERFDRNNPDFVLLKQVGGKLKAVLKVSLTTRSTPQNRFQLTFKFSGKRYVLRGILEHSEKYAFSAQENGGGRETAALERRFVLSPDLL
jgi:hypothetical protein